MSTNDKQTKRERKEEARKARMQAQQRAARRKQMRRVYSLVGLAAVIALIVALVSLSGRSSRVAAQELDTLATEAGCTAVQNPASEGATHVNPPESVTYRTEPPTSGNHYPQTAFTGPSSTPIPSENAVHNLEHGAIELFYTESAPQDIKDALIQIATKDNTFVIAAPRPELASANAQVGVVAWTRLSTCATPSSPSAMTDFVNAFIKQYRGKGPEGFIPGTPNGSGAPAPAMTK